MCVTLFICLLSVYACVHAHGLRPTTNLSPGVDKETVKYWKAVIEVPADEEDDPNSVEDEEGRIDNVDGFILDEMYLYHNVDVKFNTKIEKPVVQLFNKQDDIVETADISGCQIQDIEKLLLYRGFYKKVDLHDKVPDEYLDEEWRPVEDLDL